MRKLCEKARKKGHNEVRLFFFSVPFLWQSDGDLIRLPQVGLGK